MPPKKAVPPKKAAKKAAKKEAPLASEAPLALDAAGLQRLKELEKEWDCNGSKGNIDGLFFGVGNKDPSKITNRLEGGGALRTELGQARGSW